MKTKKYSIDEILTYFIWYRRWVTGDSIDPIGDVDFESELWRFLTYMKNASTPNR